MKLRDVYCALLLVLLVPVFASTNETRMDFADGTLDLSTFPLGETSTIELVGFWRFYPSEILSPEDIETREKTGIRPPEAIRFPGMFEEQTFGGQRGPHFGMGTCVIDVRLPPRRPELFFRTELIQCSSRVFIDGKPFGEPVVTDPAKPNSIPTNRPTYFPIAGNRESIRIVLQISNYWDSLGTGMQTAPKLVTARVMERDRSFGIGYESFLVGILIFVSIYHLMLFLIQRRDKAILAFGFIAFAVVFRQLSISEKYWLSELGMRHFALLRVEHGSAYVVCALFALYFRFLYPKESLRIPCLCLAAAGLVFLAFPIFAEPRVFSALILPMHVYIALTVANAIYTIARAVRAGEPQSLVMLFGVVSLALPTSLDILTTYTHTIGRYLMPLGLLPFLSAQSFLLAKRYTRGATEAESLRVTNARLTVLDGIKTNFLANVSHELRTPVTLIMAPVESIMNGEYGDSVPKDHPVFSLIRENSGRLIKLIENLLSLTRLESAEPYELVPVDLSEMVTAYLDEFSALAAKSGVGLRGEWRKDDPVFARIDPKAFETVFFNLMSNAIKFTPSGGSVTVLLSRANEKREPGASGSGGGKTLARIEIRDTGIGIPNDELARIFSRYARVYDAERKRYDGTGLGLAIALGTAKAIGGTIWATSEPGCGSSFFLDLPECDPPGASARDAGRAADARASSSETSNALSATARYPLSRVQTADAEGLDAVHRSRILVVEDHDDMRLFVAESLSRDHEIIQARDGNEALGAILDGPAIDLVVSDIMMPNLDGIGLLKALRTDQRTASVPVIFLTARNDPDERIRRLRDGAVDYIAKPFSVEELRARICAVLRHRDGERRQMIYRLQSAIRGTGQWPVREEAVQHALPEIPASLTSREAEILDFVVKGMSDKEIAGALGISTRTASNHVASLLRKTGLSSRQSIRIRFGGHAADRMPAEKGDVE